MEKNMGTTVAGSYRIVEGYIWFRVYGLEGQEKKMETTITGI